MSRQPAIDPSEKSYLLGFESIFRNRAEAEEYLWDSWGRLQIAFEWLKELERADVRQVLELGANPYYLTVLLRKHCAFELSLANYFADGRQNGRYSETVDAAGERHEFVYSHFNVEVDRFPYADCSFDCVIFCEILEHLLLTADFPIEEIRRVLRPGGYVLLSTPNATRLANLVNLMRGMNIYAPYSPNGIYGRHNREYTLPEISRLLDVHRFKVEKAVTTNVYPHSLKSRVLQSLRPKTWLEHLFVLARKQ